VGHGASAIRRPSRPQRHRSVCRAGVWSGPLEDFTTGSGSAGIVYRPIETYSGALNLAYTQRAPVNQELSPTARTWRRRF